MCGRYATTRTSASLERDFEASVSDLFTPPAPDYNMAPTKEAPLVIGRRSVESDRVTTELVTARWGLVPSWAKEPEIGVRMINARSETVAEKPSFRSAFARRRALVPADGYYEWREPKTPGIGKKMPKQPFYFTDPDVDGLAFAGLYEFYRQADDSWLLTFTILTTQASGSDGVVHDRAPLLVEPDLQSDWLDPNPAPELLAQLVPAIVGRLTAWPVSRDVNNVRNNGPELVQAVVVE